MSAKIPVALICDWFRICLLLLVSETVNGLLTDSSMEWNFMSQEKRRVCHHCRRSSLLFSLQAISEYCLCVYSSGKPRTFLEVSIINVEIEEV